jgi:hypothetical protein
LYAAADDTGGGGDFVELPHLPFAGLDSWEIGSTLGNMEFQSKIFVKVSNPGARINELGSILLLGSALLFGALKLLKVPESYEYYCLCVLGLGILCMIGGRIMAKGNLFTIGLSDTELVVAEGGVRVGEMFYSHDQLTDLDFWVEGYDGMGTIVRGRIALRRGKYHGAGNKIHFRADGKKHLYQFYLPDLNSMNNLGQVFRKYYEVGIPFHECNRGGPTFLFHQVRSKNELEDLKRREGYV